MAECNTCGGYLSIEDKIRLSMKCDANGNVVWQGALVNQIPEYSDYSERVSEIGGSIVDTNLCKAEIKKAVDDGYYNQIAYWVDNSFGKKTGNYDFKKPIITFTIDDGKSTDYDTYLIFKAKGLGRATSYINTAFIGTAGYLTWDQIAVMYEDGWDFQCHGWSHAGSPTSNFGSLTNAQIVEQMVKTNEDFIAHNLPIPKHHAYPQYVTSFDRITPIVAKYRRTMRGGTGVGSHTTYDSYDRLSWFSLEGNSLDFKTSYSTIIAQIDYAIKNKTPLIITLHSYDDVDWLNGCADALDYIYAAGLTPSTIDEQYNHVNTVRDKLVNVIEQNNDGSLKDFEPIVYYDNGSMTDYQGVIIFNDTLVNIGSNVADYYKSKGYRVIFWKDESLNALAYTIPNNVSYFEDQPVTVDASTDAITVPFNIKNKILNYNHLVFFTGDTAPGGITFNTLYYIKSVVSDYSFTLTATAGGAKIDITSAGSGVLLNTRKYLDVAVTVEGAANLTPFALKSRSTNIEHTFTCGGALKDTEIMFLRRNSGQITIVYARNIFSGRIPYDFRYIDQPLFNVNLNNNLITGGIENICYLGNRNGGMNYLNVSINKIDEAIPRDIGSLNTLTNLNLSENEIPGSIPVEIGYLTNLRYLYLQKNQLTGYESGAINQNMTELDTINISDNELTSQAVNDILKDVRDMVLVTHKAGTLNLSGTLMGAASGDGLVAKNQLLNAIADLGANGNWTVTSN